MNAATSIVNLKELLDNGNAQTEGEVAVAPFTVYMNWKGEKYLYGLTEHTVFCLRICSRKLNQNTFKTNDTRKTDQSL